VPDTPVDQRLRVGQATEQVGLGVGVDEAVGVTPHEGDGQVQPSELVGVVVRDQRGEHLPPHSQGDLGEIAHHRLDERRREPGRGGVGQEPPCGRGVDRTSEGDDHVLDEPPLLVRQRDPRPNGHRRHPSDCTTQPGRHRRP
jgi:hypothetical protein